MGYGPEMFMDARCNHVSEKPVAYSALEYMTDAKLSHFKPMPNL